LDYKKLGRFFYSEKVLLIAICVAALIVRLGFMFYHDFPLFADELEYDRLAVSLLDGNGYVSKAGNATAGRPPGYPLLVSTVYLVFGHETAVVKLLQAAIDSLTCLLIYFLGRSIFSKKVGLLSAIISILHVSFIAQSSKLLTEGVSTFLLLCAVLLFRKASLSRKALLYCLSGFFLGITCMVRSNFLILSAIFLLFMLYEFSRFPFLRDKLIKGMGCYTIAFLFVIFPWSIRNFKQFHAFVPISTFQGYALYASYKPVDGKMYGFVPYDNVMKEANSIASETQQSKFLSKKAFLLLKADPLLFFRLIPLKICYFFSPLDWELVYSKVIYNYSYVFYFPFFLTGLFTFRHRLLELNALYLPVIGVLMFTIVLFGIPRFRIPIEPYMIILSAASIIHVYDTTIRKRKMLLCLCAYFTANYVLFINSEATKIALRFLSRKAGLW